MASVNPNLSDMQRAIREALNAHWRLLLFQGVLLIILGILAVVAPVAATIAVDIFIGWLFLIGGVIGLVAVFSTNEIRALLSPVFLTVLCVSTKKGF